MNILVTGASGFIGKHLIAQLLTDETVTVTGLVRKTSDIGKLSHPRLRCVYADITDAASLITAFTPAISFDVLYHCAALVDNNCPKQLERVNVIGTRNICELATRLSIPKMIYLSSVAVISGNSQIPLIENLPYHATNAYGESKIKAEKIVQHYRYHQFKEKNIKVAVFRPPMVYGPDEPHMMALLLRLLRLRLLPIINNGTQHLHMVYVQTLVEALVYCLDKNAFFEGEFFIADNDALSVAEILTIMGHAVNAAPWYMPNWLSNLVLTCPLIGKKLRFFLKDRVYSIEKIQRLGFIRTYDTRRLLEKSALAKINKNLSKRL